MTDPVIAVPILADMETKPLLVVIGVLFCLFLHLVLPRGPMVEQTVRRPIRPDTPRTPDTPAPKRSLAYAVHVLDLAEIRWRKTNRKLAGKPQPPSHATSDVALSKELLERARELLRQNDYDGVDALVQRASRLIERAAASLDGFQA